jgi:nucleotide-binding universal stress UspA family protein
MKQIIVPTDFSAPAENAMLYAGGLAERINAGILLLHIFQVPISMSEVPVLMISPDELKHNADSGLERIKEILQLRFPSLNITTESRMGDVSDELNEVCKALDVFAIITGKHGASGIERFFFGSTSLSIIRHTTIPVIAVPEKNEHRVIKQIALAIDDQKEELPVEKIKEMIDDLGAELHIIHVQPGNTGNKELDAVVAGLNAKCKTIHDDEFLHGIQTYLAENNIDLLMILPHKHNFFDRLTLKTHTEELLSKLTIPVMCISKN